MAAMAEEDAATAGGEDTPEVPERQSRQQAKKKRARVRTRRAAAPDNSDDDRQQNDQGEAESPATRPRRRSEAGRRDKLERQRERNQSATELEARTNNRFLRATSRQRASSDAVETPEEMAEGEEEEDDEPTAAARLLPKRSPATFSTTSEGIVVTPGASSSSNWFRGHNMVTKWTEELEQHETAGLFVEQERRQITRLEPSTLNRLEERLWRELGAAKTHRGDKEVSDAKGEIEHGSSEAKEATDTFLLRELLVLGPEDPTTRLLSNSQAEDEDVDAVTSPQATVSSGASMSTTKVGEKATISSFALLELFVDRVVLDDHRMFALADRLAAQLRALHAAYARLQQQQPWQLSLQRLDEVFLNSDSNVATETSADQRGQEVVQLLTELEALGQLHQQLLAKANELRDAGTRSGLPRSLRVKPQQRTQPIDLSRVAALLELMRTSSVDNQRDGQETEPDEGEEQEREIRQLSERLSAVSATAGHALRTVLLLKSEQSDAHATDSSVWSPRFYVVLRVNGKVACVTKTRSWIRGEVRFAERLRFALPFFPTSVCAEVYERRTLVRDVLLSTSAIPVLVPGYNINQKASSRACSSPFDGWGPPGESFQVPVASLAPSDEWYQFSSTTPISRLQWHRSFHDSSLFAHATRRPQGRLHLRATWVQNTALSGPKPVNSVSSDTVYLPPRRPETAGGHRLPHSPVQLIGKPPTRDKAQLSRHLHGFSNERDFLRLVEPQQLLLDPNDPENAAVRRLQTLFKQQQQEQVASAAALSQREVFRTRETFSILSVSGGGGRGLTKRNRLLRLRDREHVARHGTSSCAAITSHEGEKVEPPRWRPQHAVFDEPLPLAEHELVADERLLRLLRPELRAFDRRLQSEEADRADASIVDRHRLRQLLKLQDFRERVRQTQIASDYNNGSTDPTVRSGRTRPLATIVQELPLPLFPGTLELPSLWSLIAPRRRLRPRAKAPAAVPPSQAAAHWPTACTLYVQVQKAANVPVRLKPPRNATEGEEIATSGRRRLETFQRMKKSPRILTLTTSANEQSEATTSDGVLETPRVGSVLEYESHVFVQVTFQGKTRQTSCTAVMGRLGRSNSTAGAHPVWMETLALPFRPPRDDWSPAAIMSAQDVIRFSLFDQVTRPATTATSDEDEQTSRDERLGAQTRSLHRENCFLGSLEVPFSTLYRTGGRLDTSLRCEMPVEHLGYANLQASAGSGAGAPTTATSTAAASVVSTDGEAASPRQRRARGFSRNSPTRRQVATSPRSPTSSGASLASEASGVDDAEEDSEGLNVARSAREATFLKLTLQLDPVLPVLAPTADEENSSVGTSGLSSTQDKLLIAHAQRWAAAARRASPAEAARHRNYSAFVRNLSHGATFLPRFLRSQAPPTELSSASLRALVRFVSLIPFLDDWLAFDGAAKDVWSTSQEFLAMGAGDHEEHAVLLANLFTWHDRKHHKEEGDRRRWKSYIVVGHAVPEGNAVYVLRRGVLWNASVGVGYAVSDTRCPLRDASLVVSSDNIFANVQPLLLAAGAIVGGCHDLNWDIEDNAKCWKPFFPVAGASMPPSVQSRELSYGATPPEFVEQVERELREALKLALRRWRSSHFATTFNEAAGLQLREHLVLLEREASAQDEAPESAPLKTADADTPPSSPRSSRRLKQKLRLKLHLPMQRLRAGGGVLRELQRSREVCGLPLHVSFTDIPRVLDIVESTVRCCVGWEYTYIARQEHT
ncbi:hypothetical protein BBJ28_00012826 [Nothophytophthora sp. Chile5]|nr:hypothetical protein BBJ28_00012826 [Nothophytophthora sp. Chile5]